MGKNQQPVHRVGAQRQNKQAVLQIIKTPHNASNTMPVPIASKILNHKIMT
jgi:hypothetical protein